MKERALNLKPQEVRGIIDGRKTQIRRIVKPQPYVDGLGNACWNGRNFGRDEKGPLIRSLASPLPSSKTKRVNCPYGAPGDRLWGRETWAQPTSLDPGPTFYRADYPICVPREYENVPPVNEVAWKSPAIMPRWASRILLEITAVRVERLQDISEADAKAEVGTCTPYPDRFLGVDGHLHESPVHRMLFQSLWEANNSPGSWDENPWVWVIKFKRILEDKS